MNSQAVYIVKWIHWMFLGCQEPCWHHYLLDLEVGAGKREAASYISWQQNKLSKKWSSWIHIILVIQEKHGFAYTWNIYLFLIGTSLKSPEVCSLQHTEHTCTGLPAQCFLGKRASTSIKQCIFEWWLSSLTLTWFENTCSSVKTIPFFQCVKHENRNNCVE